ncbi:carbohydrate-binding protein [Kineococcus gypseus]|uniref:carbohydrate-binding protein n=1 Tax=Kineococcus gypseus TaxID=1637102 RepID=UPI003D7E3755
MTVIGAGLAAAPASAATELITNGGFEDDLTGWFANDGNAGDTAELAVTDDAFSGDSAVLVTERGTTGSGPMQDLSGKLRAGETYQLSARIKYDDADSPDTKQFFMTVHFGGASYANMGTVTVRRGEWGLIDATFTVPAGQDVSTARVFLETPWVADPQADPDVHLMDFVVDDVSLEGVEPPPPPPPASRTVEVVGKLPGDSNPLISHKFGADAFGMVDGDRVYLYMTNDTQGYAPDPATGVSPQIDYGDIDQITVISSEDLVNWTDHGEIQVAGPAGVAPYTNNSWAPGAVQRVVDGEEKTFLYYANGGGSSNVIVGDSPLGPWNDERDSTLIDGRTPGAQDVAWKFDPSPFVDDDGDAHLFFGGGPASTSLPAVERFNNPKNIRVIDLADDMVNTEGTARVVDTPVSFEAGHVFEREGRYYLSYSSHFGGPDFGGDQPRTPGYPGGGEIGYMISDQADVWPKEKYAGVLFPNQSQFFGPGTGGNNHQSVFELGGEHYFTHHAPTLNKRINGDRTQGYRSPHIEKLEFDEDGTIQQVVGTYEGVEQVKDLDPYQVLEAETIAWRQGLTTVAVDAPSRQFGPDAPNLALTDIDDGDWTSLSSVDFGAHGAASFTAGVRAPSAGASIELRLDDREAPVVATIDVPAGDGGWSEVSTRLEGVTGVHDVYMTFTGPEGEDLLEVDTWEFTAAEAWATDVSLADVLGQDTSGPEAPPRADGSDFDLLSVAVERVLTARPDSPVAALADPQRALTALLPDDDAFVAALEATARGRVPHERAAAARLRTSPVGELERLLLGHVVLDATLTSEDVLAANGAELTTAGGSTLTVRVDGDRVSLLDDGGRVAATVTAVDVNRGQVQVAHVIDRVLLLG